MEEVSHDLIDRLTKVVCSLEALQLDAKIQPLSKPEEDISVESSSLKLYDSLVDDQVQNYCLLSEKIGGLVHHHAGLIKEVFLLERQFLSFVNEHSAPNNLNDLDPFLQPIKEKIEAVVNFREENRRSEFFNHLSAVSESVTALGWITISNPPKYIKELQNAGQFYANRVLKDFRQIDVIHCDWVRSWMAVLTKLEEFTFQHHRNGPSWNPKGISITADAVNNYTIQQESSGKETSTKDVVSDIQQIPATTKNVVSDVQQVPNTTKNVVSDVQQVPNTTKNVVSDVQQVPNTTKNVVSDVQQVLGTTKNVVSDVQQVPDTTKNIVSDVQQVPDTTKNVVSDVQQVPATTKDVVSDVQQVPDTTKDVVSDVQQVPDTTKDVVSDVQQVPATTKDVVSDVQQVPDTTKNVVSDVQQVPDTTKDVVSDVQQVPDTTKNSAPLRAEKVVQQDSDEAIKDQPLTQLDGAKWNVQHHKDNSDIIIESTDLKQTVYIFKCQASRICIRGKVNSIVLDNCCKTGVVFDGLVGAFHIINCQSVQVQALGSLATVNIDKTDGCQVYLSQESLYAQIFTAKSSEMNVLLPIGNDADFEEFPIPEQFKTILSGNSLKTQVHAGL